MGGSRNAGGVSLYCLPVACPSSTRTSECALCTERENARTLWLWVWRQRELRHAAAVYLASVMSHV